MEKISYQLCARKMHKVSCREGKPYGSCFQILLAGIQIIGAGLLWGGLSLKVTHFGASRYVLAWDGLHIRSDTRHTRTRNGRNGHAGWGPALFIQNVKFLQLTGPEEVGLIRTLLTVNTQRNLRGHWLNH